VGYDAGREVTTATKQTFLGNFSGKTQSTGNNNTYIGYDAGSLMTTGSDNTILGGYNGNQNSLDLRTADNNIVLSDGDGNPHAYRKGSNGQWKFSATTSGDIGFIFDNDAGGNPYGIAIQTSGSADNDSNEYFIACADSNATRFIVFNNGNVRNTNNDYGAISDVKLKEQITDASSQWNDIKALTIRKYKMKEEVSAKGDSDDLWKLGVVAQELETAGMNGLVHESVDRDKDMVDLGTTTKSVKYSILYMKAVKALQEAMTRIETLEADVKALKGE
jgi:hypothetical protein